MMTLSCLFHTVKIPHIRAKNFEMSLFMLLCDDVVPAIKVQVRNTNYIPSNSTYHSYVYVFEANCAAFCGVLKGLGQGNKERRKEEKGGEEIRSSRTVVRKYC